VDESSPPRTEPAAVPSWTAVTFVLVRPGGELPVTVLSRDTQLPVRASLTVPLRGRHPDLLVLRAAAPGAFLLLADDFAPSAAGQKRVVLDEDLTHPPRLTDQALVEVMTDIAAVDRAVGSLLGFGLHEAQAYTELHRRAGASGTTLAAASSALLAATGRTQPRCPQPPARPPPPRGYWATHAGSVTTGDGDVSAHSDAGGRPCRAPDRAMVAGPCTSCWRTSRRTKRRRTPSGWHTRTAAAGTRTSLRPRAHGPT